MANRAVRVVAAGLGLFSLVIGAWAFFAPFSFYETLATFEPYNRHFLHDVGAFQIGLGIMVLGALFWKDALLVALVAYGSASVIHAVSHYLDRDLGGRPELDIPGLAGVAALTLAAAIIHARRRRTES